MIKPTRSVFLLIVICLPHARADEPKPTLPTAAELRTSRDAIYAELDKNTETVKQCFEMLDATDKTDLEARQFLDSQIQQFDDRSNALHDELAEIEKFEFLEKRRQQLVGNVARLQHEAEQWRKTGHHVPARLKLAKAKSIQQSLADGTWKILADDDWCRDAAPADLISVLQLNIEIENLKQQTSQLQGEVQILRNTVERLERLLDAQSRAR